MPIGVVYAASQDRLRTGEPDTLDEPSSGQWVRERILTVYPNIVRDGGADLDVNGRIDAHERLIDANGNGRIDADDFIAYYARNREIMEKAIPYFGWVAALDPDNLDPYNPIHDHLSLSARFVPIDHIRDTYRWLGAFIAGAHMLVHPAMHAAEWRFVLMRELKHYARIDTRADVLPDALFAAAVHPDDAAAIIAGAAHQLGLAMHGDDDEVFAATAEATAVRGRSLLARSYARHAHLHAVDARPDEAGAYYKRATELDPDTLSHRLNLGEILLRHGKHDDALKIYTDILGGRSDSAAFVGIGRAHAAGGWHGAALHAFTDAIEADPLNAAAHFYRGRHMHNSGKMRAALIDYTRAFKLDPSFTLAYYYSGVILQGRGRLSDALWCFTKAIESDPHGASAMFFNERGMIHHSLRRPDDAERDFDEAVRRNPALAQGWINRAYLRHERKRYLESLADFDRALAIDSSHAEARTGRGHLLLDLKQTDRALADFQAAVLSDPHYPDAHFGMGLIYAERSRDIDALKSFTAAIDADVKRAPANYFHQRGLLWEKLEKWDHAHADYSAAIDRDRNLAQAYHRRSEIRKRLKDYLGSQSDLAAACRLDPTICERK